MRVLAWIWPKKWWQWSLLALAAVLLAFLVLLPRFLREAIEAQLARATTARVQVADVDVHFWRRALTVHDVTLTLPEEKQSLFSVKQLVGSIQFAALLRREVVLEEIRLVGVQVAAVRQKDGHFNLAKLLPPSSPDAPPSDLPTLTVERVQLTDVRATYQDLTRSTNERLSLNLQEVTTGPVFLQTTGLAEPISLRWNGELNQGALEGSAQIFWQRSQTQVDATINARQLPLALIEPYLHEIITFQKFTGQADAQFHYVYQSNSVQTLAHTLDGAVMLKQVRLMDSAARPPMLHLPSGSVQVDSVDFLTREVRLATIELRDPELFLLQTEAGLNWASLFPHQPESVAQNPQPPNEQQNWRYEIHTARVNGGGVLFRDEAWPEAETVKIVPTQLEVREIRSDVQEAPIHFQLAVGVGQVVGEGVLSFAPVGVKAQASLSELWLTPLYPLLVRAASIDQIDAVLNGNLLVELAVKDRLQLRLGGVLSAAALFVDGLPASDNTIAWKHAQLEVGEGSMILPTLDLRLQGQISDITLSNLPQGNVFVETIDGDLRLTQRAPDNSSAIRPADGAAPAPEVSLHGHTGIKGFVVRQGPHNTEVLSWYQARAELQEGSRVVPLDLRFAEVALEYPYVQGFRTTDGAFQLAKPSSTEDAVQLSPVNGEDAAPTLGEQESRADISAPVVSPQVQITHASILGGQLYFEDHAVVPSQTIYWQDIRVDLNGVGYPFARPTAFTLHAFNMDGAPIEVNGSTKQQGQQLVTQVEGTIDRLTISRFNVYLAPQLGYRVRQGSVSVKWKLMMPGDLLHADAAVTLHDFGLGGKESTSGLEEQVGLPMHLIVALLKDLNGNINLQLPVEGRLNEPGFRLGGTVWRAIRDVLVGAVTSPLKLLGALFRKENSLKDFVLNPIGFEPGTSHPDAAGIEQLARLKLFLSQRPEVGLRLSGSTGEADALMRQDQLILARLQAQAQDSAASETPAAGEQGRTAEDLLVEEIRTFLAHRLKPTTNAAPPPLSDQGAAFLAQLRKDTSVTPQELQQLAQARVETVIAALTEGATVSAKRLHVSPKRVRGRGEPAVQYVIQAGEEN